MTLLIATTNPGKIREIRLALSGVDAALRTLADTGVESLPAPDETGRTFADNAVLKADYYRGRTGLATVAEDSGLVIDALGGRPGVESARYPGDTYAEKFARLYDELAGVPRPWTARFVCAVALAVGPGATARTWTAAVEGEIAGTPRGTNGFGYDPIFFFPPYGTTLGDVSDTQKLAVSHRGAAFRLFRAAIASAPDLLTRDPSNKAARP